MYIAVLLVYVSILFLVGWFVSRRSSDNESFFSARHASPWFMVAFGMIGASVSGISVVSVPGMVTAAGWSYLQTCFGFFFGYVAVAYILLPVYYRMNLTSIYQYLSTRFGSSSRLSGAWLFIVAKMVGSAAKFYVAVIVLRQFVFAGYDVPLWLVALVCVAVMWLYTMRSGIKTIVWTDALQTFFLLGALIVLCVGMFDLLDLDFSSLYTALKKAGHTRIFVFDDFASPRNFWKQFVSGIFIVIVMTGLDQDMMQKNLTCRTLRQSQRNMLLYGAAFVPVNFLFLLLGSMILLFADSRGIALPEHPDGIVPFVVAGFMSPIAGIAFMVGIVSATFSSADSALAAITTEVSVNVVGISAGDIRSRRIIHVVVSLVFVLVVLLFGYFNGNSVIDTIYTIVGYAYGPLLGLFAFGLFTRRNPLPAAVPVIVIMSPLLCYVISCLASACLHYTFGYELLLLNGMLAFLGLWIVSSPKKKIITR